MAGILQKCMTMRGTTSFDGYQYVVHLVIGLVLFCSFFRTSAELNSVTLFSAISYFQI